MTATSAGLRAAQHVANRDAIRAAAAQARGDRFYVTVQDAGRTGFLLGPYDTRADALANVERGRRLACEGDVWAAFYSFGTASLPAHVLPRVVFA